MFFDLREPRRRLEEGLDKKGMAIAQEQVLEMATPDALPQAQLILGDAFAPITPTDPAVLDGSAT